jgi:phage baseplate assembly protein W
MSRADRITELSNKDEVYSDFLVNLNPHPVSGVLLRFANEKAVTRAIRNLILTNKGERLYQPDVGSSIRAMLFEPMSQFAANTIRKIIEDCITKYEPRAKIINVQVVPYEDLNRYVVTIVYILINKPDPISVNITLQRVQ